MPLYKSYIILTQILFVTTFVKWCPALVPFFYTDVGCFFQGLLHGDRFLAGALWRMLFMQAEDIDPCDLETMVQYVRKNVSFSIPIPPHQKIGGVCCFTGVHLSDQNLT